MTTPPQDTLLLVCTYTNNDILAHLPKGEHGRGVYSLRLDGATGSLSPLAISDVGPNPAFVLKHPTKPIVYCSTECIMREEDAAGGRPTPAGHGEILTLQLNERDGSLTELGRRAHAGGRSTCYLNLVDGAHLAVVNYWDAVVSLFAVSPSTGRLRAPRPLSNAAPRPCDAHTQPGAAYVTKTEPDREEHWTHRQRWPHTHCFVTEPYSGTEHFVPDLGEDAVLRFSVNPSAAGRSDGGGRGALVHTGTIKLEKGLGPRHLVFHPSLHVAYVINELRSSVSVLKYQPPLGSKPTWCEAPVIEDGVHDPKATLRHVQTLSTLPADFECRDHHKSHASEIRVHPNGRTLYVANRGHDSIAVYSIAVGDDQPSALSVSSVAAFDAAVGDGTLRLVQVASTLGAFPRNFNFDATGRWMVIGNQNSNELRVFEIDSASGMLSPVDQPPTHVPSPNYVGAIPVAATSEPASAQRLRTPELLTMAMGGLAIAAIATRAFGAV